MFPNITNFLNSLDSVKECSGHFISFYDSKSIILAGALNCERDGGPDFNHLLSLNLWTGMCVCVCVCVYVKLIWFLCFCIIVYSTLCSFPPGLNYLTSRPHSFTQDNMFQLCFDKMDLFLKKEDTVSYIK